MTQTATTTFTVKITQTIQVQTGSIPAGLIAELLRENGNGLLTNNFSVYDIGQITETVDSVEID